MGLGGDMSGKKEKVLDTALSIKYIVIQEHFGKEVASFEYTNLQEAIEFHIDISREFQSRSGLWDIRVTYSS